MLNRRNAFIRSEALRRVLIWASHVGIFAVAAAAAFLLRFGFILPPLYLHVFPYALAVWITVKILVFRAANLDRGLWRYVAVSDLLRISAATFIASLISYFLIRLFLSAGLSRPIFFLDFIFSFLGACGLRLLARVTWDFRSLTRSQSELGKRIFIYGAGDAGITLLREIRNNPKLTYRVCGFIDDDPAKHGLRIGAVQVLGSGSEIKALSAAYRIEMILIAIPSATGPEMASMLSLCHEARVQCRTIPGLGDLIQGDGLAAQIREVAVEDLLNRTPVRLEESRIRYTLMDRIVLVTGAAGSIGSELCRQIARFHAAGIVGFDIAESPLFEIDREMRQSFPHVPFHAEIGSVQNRARLNDVLRYYRPSLIFHAAAYKHVPLMEAHAFEAIENNVFGTYNLAVAAAENGVEDLVMISSDKAVRPTNVMGASKRIAELILLALQNGSTQYIAVRFGNVLGSNGSVIPTFKKQIAAGGPVTVTHPEMRRFFMTNSEACQLVLQASAIAKGGQICVLDMGQAVRIVDLAKNLILLSGLKPGEDIKIEFTGTRPGEKLYEELSNLLEDTIPSGHEKVRIFIGNGVPEEDIATWLESLREACEARDIGRLVVALKELIPDYSPSVHMLRRITGLQESGVVFASN